MAFTACPVIFVTRPRLDTTLSSLSISAPPQDFTVFTLPRGYNTEQQKDYHLLASNSYTSTRKA